MAPATIRVCADCGDVIDLTRLGYWFGRLICRTCYRSEADHAKKDAEIWILERRFLQEAAR